MAQFFDSTISIADTSFILNEEESLHICKVLRLKNGQEIELVNGKGSIFQAKITDAHPKKCAVEILSFHTEKAADFEIHIAIAPTKNMDRLEWMVEKCTELGATHFTFLLCKNNERKILKIDRLEKIAISAMKQSKRKYLPTIASLPTFKDFVKQHPAGLIAHCYEGEKSVIKEAITKKNCPILIGPEGDFSIDEVDFALANGYKAISLGNNRLRTETAGLFACMQNLVTFQV
ncbi:MAG: 16S rRNA (uracil(1498)-N(3))-methyltransferase [Bacteroidota bacterium]